MNRYVKSLSHIPSHSFSHHRNPNRKIVRAPSLGLKNSPPGILPWVVPLPPMELVASERKKKERSED